MIVDRAVAAFLAGVKASYNSGRKGKESAQRLDLGVPGFTLPFNIVGWVIWSVLLRVEAQVRWDQEKNSLDSFCQEQAAEGPEEEVDLDIDWQKLCLGSVYAMGQVVVLTTTLDNKTPLMSRCTGCTPSLVPSSCTSA